MERLHKKCLIASAGIHSLLLLILVVGPAFVADKQPDLDDMPILDFIPLKTVDELVSGGGNPNAKPPAAQLEQLPPPKPVVQPPAPKPVQPEPKPEPEPVKPPPAREPEVKKPVEPVKKKLPDISLDPVVRKPSEAEKKAKQRETAERLRQEKEARQRADNLAAKFEGLANSLRSELSTSTKLELLGPGGGGVPYANFLQALKSIYSRAWTVPDGVTDDDATAVASVTIARDGAVLDFRITRSSRNSDVDRSVEALERIKRAVPLPDSAKEDQRTVKIEFNVRARRNLG